MPAPFEPVAFTVPPWTEIEFTFEGPPPRRITLGDALPAPMPVPPDAVYEPSAIVIESHVPDAPVPIPAAEEPPDAVREPPDVDRRVIAEESWHSRPACEIDVDFRVFAFETTNVTSLFETAMGVLAEMSTSVRWTSRLDPEILTECDVVFPKRLSFVRVAPLEMLLPLHAESFDALTVTAPFARSQVSPMAECYGQGGRMERMVRTGNMENKRKVNMRDEG
jgi:hypothetical protein